MMSMKASAWSATLVGLAQFLGLFLDPGGAALDELGVQQLRRLGSRIAEGEVERAHILPRAVDAHWRFPSFYVRTRTVRRPG